MIPPSGPNLKPVEAPSGTSTLSLAKFTPARTPSQELEYWATAACVRSESDRTGSNRKYFFIGLQYTKLDCLNDDFCAWWSPPSATFLSPNGSRPGAADNHAKKRVVSQFRY